jgi:hypothetical protein
MAPQVELPFEAGCLWSHNVPENPQGQIQLAHPLGFVYPPFLQASADVQPALHE